MKKHKLTNVDGVDEKCFECFYSPAKRRGPVPGNRHKQKSPSAAAASAATAGGRRLSNASSNGASKSAGAGGSTKGHLRSSSSASKGSNTSAANSAKPAAAASSSSTAASAAAKKQQPKRRSSMRRPTQDGALSLNPPPRRASLVRRRSQDTVDGMLSTSSFTIPRGGERGMNTGFGGFGIGGPNRRPTTDTMGTMGSFGGFACMSFTSNMLDQLQKQEQQQVEQHPPPPRQVNVPNIYTSMSGNNFNNSSNNMNNNNNIIMNNNIDNMNNSNSMNNNNINNTNNFNSNGGNTETSQAASALLDLNLQTKKLLPPLDPSAAAMQQHVLSTLGTIGLNMFANVAPSLTNNNNNNNNNNGNSVGNVNSNGNGSAIKTEEQDSLASAQNSAQQQLAYVQQLQLQQQIQAQKHRREMNALALENSAQQDDVASTIVEIMQRTDNSGSGGGGHVSTNNGPVHSSNRSVTSGSTGSMIDGMFVSESGRSRAGGSSTAVQQQQQPIQLQRQLSPQINADMSSSSAAVSSKPQQKIIGCAHPSVLKYAPLLEPSNPSGMHLRACYTLSFGGLWDLPTIPTNEEYCYRFDKGLEPHQLPKFDVAALQAARFAELALGALADSNDVESNGLMTALTNASVLCLRDCVEERVHPSLMFDVSRAFFFHAILRMQLDKDMVLYFKYRRVCLRHLSQLDGFSFPGVTRLMAAISFQDSLVYMINNAPEEDEMPNIDRDIPRATPPHPLEGLPTTNAEKKYGISTSPSRVASNPMNQMWIQGVPPVFINESAPLKSRLLDALACTIRTSLDEAKSRQTKEEPQQSSRGRIISRKRKFLSDAEESKDKSATEWAIEHHPNDLSCSKLLNSAYNLLEADQQNSSTHSTFGGHSLLILALDIMSDREMNNVTLQSILNVIEGIMERPILLFQGGPTYHIITNCVIYLARMINKYSNDVQDDDYDRALDIYNGSRLVLEKHRKKLPYRLQCHELPRASTSNTTSTEIMPVIDLSNMNMCTSFTCQDCVAIDGNSTVDKKEIATNKKKAVTNNNGQKSDSEELDINDQALMWALSRIISQED